MQLSTWILDDPDSLVSHQYNKLAALGVLVGAHSSNTSEQTLFYPQLLSIVAQSLRVSDNPLSLSPLIKFWQQQGLLLHPRALAAMEEILQADLEERQWRMVEHAEAAVVDESTLVP